MKKKKYGLYPKLIVFTLAMANILGILGNINREAIASANPKRTIGLKQRKGKKIFTHKEDEKLKKLVGKHGYKWPLIAEQMPNRDRKACRERYLNYLVPGIEKGKWTEEEDELLLEKAKEFNNGWKKMLNFFNGRTDMQLKNRYHLLQRKKTGYKKRGRKKINRKENLPQTTNSKLRLPPITTLFQDILLQTISSRLRLPPITTSTTSRY